MIFTITNNFHSSSRRNKEDKKEGKHDHHYYSTELSPLLHPKANKNVFIFSDDDWHQATIENLLYVHTRVKAEIVHDGEELSQ